MFNLTAPSEDKIRRFISEQKDSGFSYPEVGASATAPPAGYNVDRHVGNDRRVIAAGDGCEIAEPIPMT